MKALSAYLGLHYEFEESGFGDHPFRICRHTGAWCVVLWALETVLNVAVLAFLEFCMSRPKPTSAASSYRRLSP